MAESLVATIKSRDRERWLSILWAPAPARPALVALHAFDLEQQRIVADTKESLLGEIKLAWWREQLDALGKGGPPQAQPILRALATEAIPRGVNPLTLSSMEEGFLPLLLDGPLDAPALARARGVPLFEALATVIAGAPLAAEAREAAAAAGVIWAWSRLLRGPWGEAGQHLAGLRLPAIAAAPRPLPPSLRGLTHLALDDCSRAAGGRKLVRPAAPARQWRFLRAALMAGHG